MGIERNQIFILLRSVLRDYRKGLLLGDWQCGIGNVVLRLAIYDGAGLGLLGAINGGRRGRWVGPGWGFV